MSTVTSPAPVPSSAAQAARRWVLRPALAGGIPQELHEQGLPEPLVRVLAGRGIATPEIVQAFLNPQLSALASPQAIPGIADAVTRLTRAIDTGETIAVYGDYDADGVTATVLLRTGLEALGGHVCHHLPHRVSEGYGLAEASIRDLAEAGAQLIVTVDTGISGAPEVAIARGLGLDVIVTDHHEPPAQTPGDCVALLNPKLGGWPAESSDLSGVGVAYKLLCAMNTAYGRSPDAVESYLDLVAIGTIADVVPLLGDNRILVAHGLRVLAQGRRPGLAALAKVAGISLAAADTYVVGFGIAPRINAAGRLAHPAMAADLLLAPDELAATPLARALNEANVERQEQEKAIAAEASRQAEEQLAAGGVGALVLHSEGWHQGVIGIVASRILDSYHRPVFLLSVSGDETKGSGRSAPGFHLADALTGTSDLLTRHGGHECAAGLSMPTANIDEFRKRLVRIAAASIGPDGLQPVIELEDELAPCEVTIELARQLERLAPFGTGNPKPVFALRGVWPGEATYMGAAKNHLKVQVRTRGLDAEAVGFGMSREKVPLPNPPEALDIAFTLDINRWGGRERLQLGLKDIRPSLGSAVAGGFERLYGRLTLDDRRGSPDKKDALRWLLEDGEPSVVFLRGEHLPAQLAQALEREWPHKKGRIMARAQGCSSEQLLAAIASGQCDMVITTQPLPPGAAFPGLRRVVLYHPCKSYPELRSLLGLAAGSAEVTLHLLFSPAEAVRLLDAARSAQYNVITPQGGGSAATGSGASIDLGFATDMAEADARGILKALWLQSVAPIPTQGTAEAGGTA